MDFHFVLAAWKGRFSLRLSMMLLAKVLHIAFEGVGHSRAARVVDGRGHTMMCEAFRYYMELKSVRSL